MKSLIIVFAVAGLALTGCTAAVPAVEHTTPAKTSSGLLIVTEAQEQQLEAKCVKKTYADDRKDGGDKKPDFVTESDWKKGQLETIKEGCQSVVESEVAIKP